MTGDQADIVARLKSYLPRGWFGDFSNAPVTLGVLNGIAAVLAIMYTMIEFLRAQTRLGTSSGGWIDLWASDFLGASLPRRLGESDAAYIVRVQIALFQQRATRPAMIAVLTNLTGRVPIIFEPANPADSGCLGQNTGVKSFFGVARFGSIAAPFSALITAYRPQVTGGLAGAAYMNAAPISAFKTASPNGYFGSLSLEQTLATDADILAAINATRPVATNIGMNIEGQAPIGTLLDSTFVLDESALG